MKIIFVYNADSGFVSSLLDIGHKVISPNTYRCNLCKMTYGVIGEREEWKKYRESSKDEMEFLHKDEFENKYKEKREYPIILKMNDSNEFEELINKEELERMDSISELIHRINEL
jgi:hypothetical protein